MPIAAAKLGAEHVAAIEIDPDAIGNAEENVVRNRVADRVTVIEGDAAALLPLVAPVRVITANIISSVLLELLPSIAAALVHDGRGDPERHSRGGARHDARARSTIAVGSCVAEDHEDAWWSATIARR